MSRKNIPKKTRELVYKKYDGHCAYCGHEISISAMQIDHLVPFYNDGEETIDNYMPACRQCNYYKATFTIEKFRQHLEQIPLSLHNQMFIYRLAEKYGRFTTEIRPIKFYFETVAENTAKDRKDGTQNV